MTWLYLICTAIRPCRDPWWLSSHCKADVVRLFHAGSLTIARRRKLEKVKPWR